MSRNRRIALAAIMLAAGGALAQAPAGFEVATIKPTAPDWDGGRVIRMESANRFVAWDYTLKSLVGAAYNLTPSAISGGPGWIEIDGYDILAKTPGAVRPSLDEQMAMLRSLLADRFKLSFHRDQKELSIYALTVVKNGSKLKESTAPPDQLPALTNHIFPDHVTLPARNATMAQFASLLQRGVADRPVVDKTELGGKYDFDLEWTPDETQFGGQIRGTPAQPARPGLFTAMQEQLGLRLEATRGPVEVLVIDRVERPTAN
jgi:uncharacterized protein (TIGR03435 family)